MTLAGVRVVVEVIPWTTVKIEDGMGNCTWLPQICHCTWRGKQGILHHVFTHLRGQGTTLLTAPERTHGTEMNDAVELNEELLEGILAGKWSLGTFTGLLHC